MKKIVLFILMMLPVAVMGQDDISNLTLLYDVTFERKIDMLNLEGECYDSVRIKFDIAALQQETVKVDIWDKHEKKIYQHTFRKMNCVRATKEFDDNLIIVGKPSMHFLTIKKCDDGPKFCVVREREGLTKSLREYLWEYFKKQKQPTETLSTNTDKVYDVAEHMPQFPGGPSAMFKFIADNIHYPEDAEDKCIQERVIVGFIVECDGSISNAKVEYGTDSPLNQEALRVVNNMPKWTPGRQNGKVVRVKYTIPVTFRLQ